MANLLLNQQLCFSLFKGSLEMQNCPRSAGAVRDRTVVLSVGKPLEVCIEGVVGKPHLVITSGSPVIRPPNGRFAATF
jgi:hypothetical protein